jgi:hypothetical protein
MLGFWNWARRWQSAEDWACTAAVILLFSSPSFFLFAVCFFHPSHLILFLFFLSDFSFLFIPSFLISVAELATLAVTDWAARLVTEQLVGW